MIDIKGKTITKRKPKGERTYIRRMKQAARKEGNPNSPPPVRLPKKPE